MTRKLPAPAPPSPDATLTRDDLSGVPLMVVSIANELPPSLASHLTLAEREVALALVSGDTYADIAARRGSKVRTIANQARAIFHKLGISSRSDLARKVFSRG